MVPPGRPAHQLRDTGADQADRYIPPALASVAAEVGFHHDADLAPDMAAGPGGQRITFHHDQAGRIESVALARGDHVHQYDPATGQLAQLMSPDAIGLPLSIERDPETGLPDATRAGAVETDLDVSQFAGPARARAALRPAPLLTRSGLARSRSSRACHGANRT